MTLVTTWYTMDGKLGVNLNSVVSAQATSVNAEYPLNGQPMNLLDRVQSNMGGEWVLVQASTTVTAGQAVVISNLGIANDATSALMASGVYALGIANFQNGGGQVGTGLAVANGAAQSIGIGDFFWAILKANGGVGIEVSPSATRGTALYFSTAVPGSFTSSATSNQVHGIELIASIGTSASGPGEAIIRTYMTFGAGQ